MNICQNDDNMHARHVTEMACVRMCESNGSTKRLAKVHRAAFDVVDERVCVCVCVQYYALQ